MNFKVPLYASALMLAGTTMFADALTEPRPGEIRLGPLPFRQEVAGTPLDLRATAFLHFKEEQQQVTLRVRVVADLSDLQAKLGRMVDTIPLPTNTCDHMGVDNVVPRVWGKELPVSGSVATVLLHGDLDVWACTKNVPCSRVDWDGIVPRVTLYDCNPPINKQVGRQPFTARLPFELVRTGDQSVALRSRQPSIDLGGSLGGVTSTILDVIGVNVGATAAEAVDSAIDLESLQVSLPAELRPFTLKIVDAGFFDNNGPLGVTLTLEAAIPTDRFREIAPTFEHPTPVPGE